MVCGWGEWGDRVLWVTRFGRMGWRMWLRDQVVEDGVTQVAGWSSCGGWSDTGGWEVRLWRMGDQRKVMIHTEPVWLFTSNNLGYDYTKRGWRLTSVHDGDDLIIQSSHMSSARVEAYAWASRIRDLLHKSTNVVTGAKQYSNTSLYPWWHSLGTNTNMASSWH